MTTDRVGSRAEAIAIVQALLSGCDRILDLGCGQQPFTNNMPHATLIDLDPVHAADPRVLLLDACEVPHAFRRMTFDAVLCTDVIEHLAKAAGAVLLDALPRITRRLVFFTPLGDLWIGEQRAYGRTPDSPHNHRSGWTPAEFEERGYTTWVWPHYHKFEDGKEAGAFWAWRFVDAPTPTAADIATQSQVPP